MKDLYLVDTPLQLLNSVVHKIYHSGNNSDIWIVNQFKNAGELTRNTEKTQLFDSVVALKPERKGRLKHIWTIIGLLFPNLYTKYLLGYDVKKLGYEAIYFCAPTKLFDFIIAAGKPVYVYGIEDGIGSYYGDIFTDYLSSRYISIRKWLNHGYSIRKLFLNNTEIYNGVYRDRLEFLGEKNAKTDEILKKIFYSKTPDKKYYRKRCIYLNQPICDFDDAHKEAEKTIYDGLCELLKDDMVVRLHPREMEQGIYRKSTVESGKSMWEMICKNYINDNSLLIGMSSTAQFVPKFMYNFEPYVIFTYKLYDELSYKNVERYEKLFILLKSTYKASDKVIRVESMKELMDTILYLQKSVWIYA